MRHLKRGLGFVALAGGVAFAMPAVATQWLTSSATGGAGGMTMTVGGQTVKVRAYSTKTASTTSSTASNGLFQAANLQKYSGGFGIINTVGSDGYEGTQPEHAIDNNQIFDALVFELPSSGFDLEAFKLGWATEALAPSQTVTNEADIQAYFGGNSLGAGYDFSNACFSGCTNTLSNLGFTDLMNNGANSIDGSDVSTANAVLVPGTQSGRYLVLTGALGGTNDGFKVDMIKGSGGSGTASAPGTLALLALGLFGLVTLRRRPAFA